MRRLDTIASALAVVAFAALGAWVAYGFLFLP